MYRLSRQLIVLTILAAAYIAVLATILFWPCSFVVIIAGLGAVAMRRSAGRLTSLGSARWADVDDLQSAEMLHRESGIILGRTDPLPLGSALRKACFSKESAETVCSDLFVTLGRKPGPIVRLSRAVHTAVFSPTGGGKGVSVVNPFLLTCPESVVALDYKGELARITAAHRRRELGQRTVFLDPFHVVTTQPDTFNPLDFIDKNDPLALDECNSLAKSLVVRTGEERETCWNDGAEMFIAGLLGVVVYYGQKGQTRSLQTVRELFCTPGRLEMAIELMCKSDAGNGMLARMGGQLRQFIDREKASTLTTVHRNLRFLDTQAVAASTATSSFEPADLGSGKLTAYLTVPPDLVRSQTSLMRMWTGSLLKAVVRLGLGESKKVHFVLDEAASLGVLEPVSDAIDKLRGYGCRLHFFYQSVGQLKTCFPDGQDQTFLANVCATYFGVNDNVTAEYISNRLGEATIVLESGGTSSGRSWQSSYGAQPQESSSHSSNSSHNWQQQARKLLKPEEVMALPPRAAITFAPGLPPIYTTLLRYYEEPQLGKRSTWLKQSWDSVMTLLASAAVCGCAWLIALVLTVAVTSRESTPAPFPANPNQNPNQSPPGGPAGQVRPWQVR